MVEMNKKSVWAGHIVSTNVRIGIPSEERRYSDMSCSVSVTTDDGKITATKQTNITGLIGTIEEVTMEVVFKANAVNKIEDKLAIMGFR